MLRSLLAINVLFVDDTNGTKHILQQGLSMDEASFPFALSYLTLAQFRAAAQVPDKIKETISAQTGHFIAQLKPLQSKYIAELRATGAELRKDFGIIQHAVEDAKTVVQQLTLPDIGKIEARRQHQSHRSHFQCGDRDQPAPNSV
jgi:hypothetical protein